MRPAILIVERRHEIAEALEQVIALSNYTPVVRTHVEDLTEVGRPIAAIVIRIAFEGIGEPVHASVGRLPTSRPPVVAIASTEEDVTEATRLGCDVVLRSPGGVSRLHEVLSDLVRA